MIADILKGRRVVVRVGFADALKEECRVLYRWDGLKNDEGRALLQRVGLVRRHEDANYWIARAFEKMTDPKTLYVVDDVRFKNEAEAIRAHGGEVWRVERYDPVTLMPFDNGLSVAAKAHVSETQLDRYIFDRYLWNDTKDGLHARLKETLRNDFD
jgi:hypothetical protein